MEIDAAQYALISMEMSFTKSFLQVYQQGSDYLDKPPFLFWISSLSFWILGISNFSYKLPSVLIAVLGLYSLYRFANIHYDKKIALLSALILGSCQALFLITNDVRTDTNLMGLVIFGIWQLSEYLKSGKWYFLFFTSIGFAGALMAKGPIALIIPIAGFGLEFLVKRQWRNIFRIEWVVLLFLILLFLVPMCYGLYLQFDLHPEKFVYGLQGPSGLKFFFWTQSFGRITGENYWKNDATFFFFFHTILWDFQPWILTFIPALFYKLKDLFSNQFKGDDSSEYISLGAFVLVFVALSLSKFKLPHYIFVLFPFASVITAQFVYKINQKWLAFISKINFFLMMIFWMLIAVGLFYIFSNFNFVLIFVLAIFFSFFLGSFYYFSVHEAERYFVPASITVIAFNLLLSSHFYPNLLKYQASSEAGKFISYNQINEDNFFTFNRRIFSLDFYARRITPVTDFNTISNLKSGSYIFINENDLKEVKALGLKFQEEKIFDSYPVSRLGLPFLNPKTRDQVISKEYIVKKM